MIPIDEKTKQSDGPDKGGYADAAQPKPEIPDLIPHKPEIDHNDTDGIPRREQEPGTIYMGGNEGGKKQHEGEAGREQPKPGQPVTQSSVQQKPQSPTPRP